DSNELMDRLCNEPEFKEAGITESMLSSALKEKTHFLGNADAQITAVKMKTNPLLLKYAKEAGYEPGDIL
ncbi:adenylosuccinate lyase, partial [archaeon]|nr:adenylosuccinate lyase [archaeon]